jgi:phosphoglycerol transferase MdoB-like AlkP superfamily enzyme
MHLCLFRRFMTKIPDRQSEMNMKRSFFLAIATAALLFAAFGFQAQNRPQQAAPNADPYANNAAPGATQFPLAAPAGKDSNARNTAPPGAVNAGPFDAAKWKYGNAFDAPA